MTKNRRYCLSLMALGVAVCLVFIGSAAAQTGDETSDPAARAGPRSTGPLHFVKAGGAVGYFIVLLSFVGIGLVVDAFLHLKQDKLVPANLVAESEKLALAGKLTEVSSLCATHESLLARVLTAAFADARLGVEAARDALRESGTKEITRLHQRVGYIGLIASIAPMLGLLGTVVGMIGSFDVLGHAKGAARPDELAVGISGALVTTCMGLVVAVPLMFFHSYFRDRVTRIAQEAAGASERLLRIVASAAQRAKANTP